MANFGGGGEGGGDFFFNLFFNDQINFLIVFGSHLYENLPVFFFCQIYYMPFISSPHHLGLNLFQQTNIICLVFISVKLILAIWGGRFFAVHTQNLNITPIPSQLTIFIRV